MPKFSAMFLSTPLRPNFAKASLGKRGFAVRALPFLYFEITI
jgi:hypothetical protein